MHSMHIYKIIMRADLLLQYVCLQSKPLPVPLYLLVVFILKQIPQNEGVWDVVQSL